MPFLQGGILFSLTGKKPSQNLNGYQQSLHYPILNICTMHTSITGSFDASVKHSSDGDGAYTPCFISGDGLRCPASSLYHLEVQTCFQFQCPCLPFLLQENKIALRFWVSFHLLLYPLPHPALITSSKRLNSLKARSIEAFSTPLNISSSHGNPEHAAEHWPSLSQGGGITHAARRQGERAQELH